MGSSARSMGEIRGETVRKWGIALAILLGAELWNLWPFEMRDAGELTVVETVAVEVKRGELWLSADGYTGHGRTAEQAVEKLQASVPGQLFLRQVRRVIFCHGAEELWSSRNLPEQLPVGANVYGWPGTRETLGDLSLLNKVLAARERRTPQLTNLAQLQNGELLGRPAELPLVEQEEIHGTEKGRIRGDSDPGGYGDGGNLMGNRALGLGTGGGTVIFAAKTTERIISGGKPGNDPWRCGAAGGSFTAGGGGVPGGFHISSCFSGVDAFALACHSQPTALQNGGDQWTRNVPGDTLRCDFAA